MKKRLSFSRLLHHDKLMMVVSLLLAILIWSLVVYGQGNLEEREITGVPVSVTLNDYASETLKLRIVSGANPTATVRVQGTRAELERLSAQDITVTADTGNVIKEGTYVLQIRATSSGDFSVVGLVGDDGTTSTVTITCDVWREQSFPITVEMPKLTVTDATQYQFGTPSVSGAAVTEGAVIVAGPKSDINRIARVVANIPDEASISETAVFTADLLAYDAYDRPIDSVSFLQAEDAKVNVTVPVMVYRKVKLNPTINHIPAGYADKEDLFTITPTEVELWGVPSEVDEYIAAIQSQLVMDFDLMTPDDLKKEIVLEAAEGIRLLNGSETLTLKINLSNIHYSIVEVPLTEENVRILNCPEGYTVKVEQNRLPNVRLCGISSKLRRIKPEDIVLVVDVADKIPGQQEIQARLELGEDTVWVCYGTTDGVKVLISIAES
ncbi:MAG: hypothetical protein IJC33_02120 [Clostridia bacterium]|nr:hypothetical protein [Clostridia bacterium]